MAGSSWIRPLPIPRHALTFLYSGYQMLKTGAAGWNSATYPSTSPRMPRPVRSQSKVPRPLLAAKVPASWATMLTSMLIAFSCDWTTAEISG